MRTTPSLSPSRRGFTMIELMVVIAVVGVLVALAAPSFADYIRMQRLKGVQAELMSNLQFARAEAVARNQIVYINFSNGDPTQSCYTIFTMQAATDTQCDCTLGAGAACSTAVGAVEVRTVSVPSSSDVHLSVPAGQISPFAFDNTTGAILRIPKDAVLVPYNEYIIENAIDTTRTLRTVVGISGRPTVCAPSSTSVGAPACP